MSESRALVPVPKPSPKSRKLDEAQVKELLRLIGDRGMSLRKACRTVGCSFSTAFDALNGAQYAGQYARAREERAHHLAEQAIEIADAAQHCTSSEAVQAARLRVDTRKWFAARMDLKRWGDVARTEHTGADGGPIVQLVDVKDKLRAKLQAVAGRPVQVAAEAGAGPMAGKPH